LLLANADAGLADADVVFGTGFAPLIAGSFGYKSPHGRKLAIRSFRQHMALLRLLNKI
jgi:hypothetical protein